MARLATSSPMRRWSGWHLQQVCWVFDVNSSPALRWALAILLPITLAWKLVAPTDDGTGAMKRDLIAFVGRHGFQATEEIVNGMPMIQARSGACTIHLARLSSYGWDRDFFRRLQPGDQSFIVFRGRTYQEQPLLLTISTRLWSKFLYEIGMARKVIPVVGVLANPICNARGLPWTELAGPGTL